MEDKVVDITEKLRDRGLPAHAEDVMALQFAQRHAGRFRFIAAWSRWLCFDGAYWQQDDTLRVFECVREFCREAAATSEKAATVASAKTVAAVERLARCDHRLAATVVQFDAAPWLMNAGDMTYDLRTGIGRAPNADDYLSKTAGCAIAPRGTRHPLWTAFLDRITGRDAELQNFLRRYLGYCATGATAEHVFVFAYGTGANGKSTFVNTVAGIFGGYGTISDTATFIASNSERHPTDLAKLAGARLVVAQETQHGRRWDETKIKALTGGDKITARFMRQDFFDFTPTFKLLIAGNSKPRISNVDEAMRRRLLLVPFTVKIPPAERDPELPEKLKGEWPAILRWIIDGCLEWQRIGLAPPDSVRAATDDYFSDQDVLQQWLAECTEDASQLVFTRSAELFDSWKGWCEARNHRPGSAIAFSEALADKGYNRKREGHAGHRGFTGLAIKRC